MWLSRFNVHVNFLHQWRNKLGTAIVAMSFIGLYVGYTFSVLRGPSGNKNSTWYYWRPSLCFAVLCFFFYCKTGFWPSYCQISTDLDKFCTHLLLYRMWADLDRDRRVGGSRPNLNDYFCNTCNATSGVGVRLKVGDKYWEDWRVGSGEGLYPPQLGVWGLAPRKKINFALKNYAIWGGAVPSPVGVWGLPREKNQFCTKNYAILSKFWYFFPTLQQKVGGGDYPPSPESGETYPPVPPAPTPMNAT